MREFFYSARSESGEIVAGKLKAQAFDDAVSAAERQAEERLGMQPYRITSVVEQPDIGETGPVAMALLLTSPRRRVSPVTSHESR